MLKCIVERGLGTVEGKEEDPKEVKMQRSRLDFHEHAQSFLAYVSPESRKGRMKGRNRHPQLPGLGIGRPQIPAQNCQP